jgi:hypothetical protein
MTKKKLPHAPKMKRLLLQFVQTDLDSRQAIRKLQEDACQVVAVDGEELEILRRKLGRPFLATPGPKRASPAKRPSRRPSRKRR